MALAVVQSGFANYSSGSSGPFTITFGSSLTTGNTVYLFVSGAYFNGSFPNAGWTIESTNGAGTTGSSTQWLLSRVVQGGDGTTPPAIIVSTNAGFAIQGIEISGTPAVEAVVQSTSTSSPITGPTTANANDIGLLASGFGSGFGSYTPASGWTNDRNNSSQSTSLDNIAVPSSGTSLTASPSWSNGGTSAHWMSVALKANSAVNVSVTGAAAVGAAGIVAPAFAGSGNVTQASAGAVAGSLGANPSATLVGVASVCVGSDIPRTSSSIPGVSSLAYANPVSFYATPISYLPLNRLMRNTPVPAMGVLDNTAVAVVARLYPSGPQPVSREFFLTGVASEPVALGVNPVNNPSGVLMQAFAAPRAGSVVGSDHPEGVASHVEAVCAAGTVTVSIV